MNSVIFLGIAIVLLFLLWATGRRPSAPSLRSAVVPEESEYLVRLPASGLLKRCFAAEDVKYVASLGSRAVSRLLVQERRRLALEWLRLTRREARRLVGLHVRMVRSAPDLRPAAEFQLLVRAGAFLFVSEALKALVWFYGPFRAQAYVRSIQGLGSVLAALGAGIAQSVVEAPTSRVQTAPGD